MNIRKTGKTINYYNESHNVCISYGNSKLGRIASFSLPPFDSCLYNCKDCYARRYYLQYTRTRESYDKNLITVNDNLLLFVRSLNDFLGKYRKSHFRIHTSGDFYLKDQLNRVRYIDSWKYLIKKHKHIKFLVFTKVDNVALDFNQWSPDNLKTFYSAWIDYNLPKNVVDSGIPIAWLEKDKRIPLNEPLFKCKGSCIDCKECWNKNIKNVVFPKH